eukprot:5137401-Alexandrium_andersonii.AAC.1
MDGRGKRLTMQYSAVSSMLEVRKGLIGHVHTAGEHTEHAERWYADCVERLLRQFCTSGLGPPRGSQALKAVVNEGLCQRLREAVS